MHYKWQPIGIVRSCYKEKFGIPRQPGLVPEASAFIELYPPFNSEEAFKGLETFSHLWVIFVFHQTLNHKWKATVRPPRLGGNRRLGVFATRSPFRPNPIGISVVQLHEIKKIDHQLQIHIQGIDLLDNTPVLDIKPYLPYADSIPEADGGYAPSSPPLKIEVDFTPEALAACLKKESDAIPNLKRIIEQIVTNDPRPAYMASKQNPSLFACKLFDFDLKWEADGHRITILALHDLKTAQQL